MDGIHELRSQVARAAELITTNRQRRFFVFHHNDTDGLSSGAIVHTMLDRLGIKPRGYCLEQPYPELLRFLFEQQIAGEDLSGPSGTRSEGKSADGAVVIFADFGSGMLPTLSSIRGAVRGCDDVLIVVLDHHAVSVVEDAQITVVNPRLHGISGTSECSASAVCCEVALALDAGNWDLLPLGVLGALGDLAMYQPEPLRGVNGELSAAAVARGLCAWGDGEWKIGAAGLSAGQLIKEVDALGSLGFFSGGPDVAMKGLVEGFDERYSSRAAGLLETFSEKIVKFMASVEVRTTPHMSWFELDQSFDGYGVKTVGLVCERLLKEQRVDSRRYVAGFQRVPNRIPGVGPFTFDRVKVSMRVPGALWDGVVRGEEPGLDKILIPAARRLGGFVDACHPHAGAATVPVGKERELIEAIEGECAGWKA